MTPLRRQRQALHLILQPTPRPPTGTPGARAMPASLPCCGMACLGGVDMENLCGNEWWGSIFMLVNFWVFSTSTGQHWMSTFDIDPLLMGSWGYSWGFPVDLRDQNCRVGWLQSKRYVLLIGQPCYWQALGCP